MATTTTAAARTAIRKFQPKLCLLGAPGSGKGSYGKILAQHWGIPIVSVSNVLKQRQRQQQQSTTSTSTSSHTAAHDAAMSSGKLVDDSVVSQAVLEHLEDPTNHSTNDNTGSGGGGGGYLLDGFPRTMQQVHLMEETWPSSLQIDAAVHLDVPAHICERKMLGRRICTICGNNYNVEHVLGNGFDLPAKLPRPGECHPMHQHGVTTASLPQHHHLAARSSSSSDFRCDPATAPHWKWRDDDQPDIIRHRLEVYQQHTEPLLEHFQHQNSLFQFVPYKGFDDMPKFQSELEDWVETTFPHTVVCGR